MDINSSLWIQIVNFLILLILLNVLLFKPIRNILAKRNAAFESLSKAIDDFKNRLEASRIAIEKSMLLARKEGLAEKDALKNQGLKEENGILQQTSSVVEEKIGKARSDIELQMVEIRKRLEKDVPDFSIELAEKILGRSVK
jgi:F-type H+-transporting ATPase subunit b